MRIRGCNFRGYEQQDAGERRRGGGRGRGRGRKDQGGAAGELTARAEPQHLVDVKIRRGVPEQNCQLHSRLMTLTLALHYAAL